MLPRITQKVGCIGVLFATSVEHSLGNSPYIAELCVSQNCNEASHPLLDYDEESSECVCRSNPCWDDNGLVHSCRNSPDFPYLSFRYTETKELKCECSSIPQVSSVHVARDLCAGHMCDKAEFPILDWDVEKRECLCRAHPCWNDNGQHHKCHDPMYPLLRYRKDKVDGQEQNVCECSISMERDQSALASSQMAWADPDEPDFIDDDDM
eukprot:TRINITY_DN757_c1_g1_i1.p1 TRINITY_DN757_c1_g1~~TRINITY_DN757_c1_g1_i1.p1  ORF type:complete len:209 (-),score=20.06 TRINITY_DN757_c1_g1_i1:172-798(-)